MTEPDPLERYVPDETFTERFIVSDKNAVQVTYAPLIDDPTSSGYNATQEEDADVD